MAFQKACEMSDVSKIDCPPPSPSKVLNLEQYHRFLMSSDEIIFLLVPIIPETLAGTRFDFWKTEC